MSSLSFMPLLEATLEQKTLGSCPGRRFSDKPSLTADDLEGWAGGTGWGSVQERVDKGVQTMHRN